MRGHSNDPLRAISRARRRAILRAVRHGEAVRDPQDAPLAVIAAKRVVALSGRTRRFRRWLLLHLAVLALLLIVFGYVELVLLGALGLSLLGVVLWTRLRANAQRAVDANTRLAAAFGLQVPEDPLAADAQSGISLNVRPGVAVGVVTAVVVLVVAGAIVLRDGGEAGATPAPRIAAPPLAVWTGRANASCRSAARELGAADGLQARNGVLRTLVERLRDQMLPEDKADRPSQVVDALYQAVLRSEDAERFFAWGKPRASARFLRQAHDWGLHAEGLLQQLGATSCAGLF